MLVSLKYRDEINNNPTFIHTLLCMLVGIISCTQRMKQFNGTVNTADQSGPLYWSLTLKTKNAHFLSTLCISRPPNTKSLSSAKGLCSLRSSCQSLVATLKDFNHFIIHPGFVPPPPRAKSRRSSWTLTTAKVTNELKWLMKLVVSNWWVMTGEQWLVVSNWWWWVTGEQWLVISNWRWVVKDWWMMNG